MKGPETASLSTCFKVLPYEDRTTVMYLNGVPLRTILGPGELTQWLGAFVIVAKDPGFIPSIHTEAYHLLGNKTLTQIK